MKKEVLFSFSCNLLTINIEVLNFDDNYYVSFKKEFWFSNLSGKAKVQYTIQSDVKIFLMTEKHRKDVTPIPYHL